MKDISAFIVEVKGVEETGLRRPFPIIALCDFASQENRVSSKFARQLEDTMNVKHTKRLRRRKRGEMARIIIRWSCEKLGQDNQENIFYIEPKAQFKILFGCGIHNSPVLPKWTDYFPGRNIWKTGKEESRKLQLSEQVADSFRQGLEDGTMLRLKKMPPDTDDSIQYVSVATLEVELDYVWRSYSYTEDILNSDSFLSDNSSYKFSSPDDLFESMDIPSAANMEFGTKEHTLSSASTNTSFSERNLQPLPLSEIPRSETSGRHPWSMGTYLDQPIYEEPQPWIPRGIAQQPKSPYSFHQCHELSPRQQLALETARTESEMGSLEYWSWDEVAKNYKHYDDDCTEPVWYNPP